MQDGNLGASGFTDPQITKLRELGDFLQRTRASRGITIDQAVEATKVRSRYLLAIEQGDLSVIPGSVYARGFVRNYADYLGLNGLEIANTYLGGVREETAGEGTGAGSYVQSARSAGKPAGDRQREGAFARRQVRERDETFRRFWGMGVGLIVIFTGVVVVYALTRGPSPVVGHPAEVSQSHGVSAQNQRSHGAIGKAGAKASQVKAHASVPTAAVVTLTGTRNTSNGLVASYTVSTSRPITVTLSTVSGPCWVQVWTDGVQIVSETIPVGQTITWTGKNSVQVTTGAATKIQMSVNGVKLGSAPGSVLTYSFTRK